MEQLGHRQRSDSSGEKGLPAELYTLYEIGAEIGRGPSSRVFDATDPRTGRKGTLKLLYPAAYSEAEQARIRREWVKQSALVESEKLLVPRASGEASKTLWLFRAKVDGVPLDVVLSDGAIVVDSAMAMVKQLAEALHELHQAGLLHRDVKPEHVLVRASFAGPPRIALIDAGLAGSIETDTRYDVFGTPGYVSPEQITGKLVGFRSDLYALGCVFYEMVTGMPLFQADSVSELLILHATAPRPPLPANLHPDARELLASLLAIEPRQRPLSAQHVINVLDTILSSSNPLSTISAITPFPSLSPPSSIIAAPPTAPARPQETVMNRDSITNKDSELNLAEIQDSIANASLLGIEQTPVPAARNSAPRPLRDETAGRFSYEQMKLEAAQRAARASAPPALPVAATRPSQPGIPAINAPGASSIAPATPPVGAISYGSIPAINARGYASVTPPAPPLRTSEAAPPPLPPISAAFTEAHTFDTFENRETDEDVLEVSEGELSSETNRFAQPQFTATETASIGGWESAPTPMFVKAPKEPTEEIDLRDATPIDSLDLERLTIPDLGRSVSMAEIAASEKSRKGIMVMAVIIAFLFGTAIAVGGTALYLRSAQTPATPAAATATPTPAVTVAPAAAAPVAAVAPATAAPAAQPVAAEPVAAEPVAAAPAPAEPVAAQPIAAEPIAAEPVAAAEPVTRSSKHSRTSSRKVEKVVAAPKPKAEPKAAKAAAVVAPAAPAQEDLLAGLEDKPTKGGKAASIRIAPDESPAASTEAAAAAAPSAFDQVRAEAREHYSAGRYKEAAAAYERATTLNPTFAGAFAGLGASRAAMGDSKGAVSAYIKAVQLAPSQSGYFAALGRAYAGIGDNANAERAYRKALSLNPNNGAAKQGLTEIGR